MTTAETDKCRWCRNVTDARKGRKWCYYGGYVCSEGCDRRACLELEQSMPGHGPRQTKIGQSAEEHIRRNWEKKA